ncbi:MAG TPA: ABC transporter permease [Nocardioidaceae bacterium]|nr:ABC transporter permease [Nocardioidaceae bacterium]
MSRTEAADSPALHDPSGGGGLMEVLRHRYLLKLLVRKEVKVRYQGSLLGMGWSYVQPLTRFMVYFLIIGVVLGLNRRVPNFAVHIVAGMVFVQLFSETFSSATRSVVRNKSLVRKVGLPREMFPVASVLVSAVNIVPGLVILFLAALLTGWHPTWHFPALLLAFALTSVWGFGVGLLFSAFNVYYRDFSKVVQIITMILPWSSPMIYAYEMVRDRLGQFPWALEIYLANPVSEAVMLSQQALWVPTLDRTRHAETGVLDMASHLYERSLILLAVGVVFVWFAQKVFTRLEASFAEQL